MGDLIDESIMIGRGHEHLVYRHHRHPRIVTKLSAHKIQDILYARYVDNLFTEDEEISWLQAAYAAEITLKNGEARELRRIFQPNRALKERRWLATVPSSRNLLNEAFRRDYKTRAVPPEAYQLSRIWTHLVVQQYTPMAMATDRLSFSFGGYCEDADIQKQDYAQVTTTLARPHPKQFSLKQFLDLQDLSNGAHLTKILSLSMQDDGLRNCLSEFLLKAIQFTTVTGQILALAGDDNVIFNRKDGTWEYVLIDAVPIPREPIFTATKMLLGRSPFGESMTDHEIALLKRGLNYVRIINGCSVALNLSRYLPPLPIFSESQSMQLLVASRPRLPGQST